MSELDLMNATRDSINSVSGHFMSFATGLFAMLAAAHFAGAQLSRMSVAILVGVFSVFSLITGVTTVGTIGEAQALVNAISRLPNPEFPSPPSELFGPMRWAVGVTLLAGYISGLVFLRECRKRPRAPGGTAAS